MQEAGLLWVIRMVSTADTGHIRRSSVRWMVLKTKIPFLCKFTLISRMETRGGQMLNILESHIHYRWKKISKACPRDDLELGKISPTSHVIQTRPGCSIQAGCKWEGWGGSKTAFRWWHLSLPPPREAGGVTKPTAKAHHRAPQLIILIPAQKNPIKQAHSSWDHFEKICLRPISICEMKSVQMLFGRREMFRVEWGMLFSCRSQGFANSSLEFTTFCFSKRRER